MTHEEVKQRIQEIKKAYCQKLIDGEISLKTLKIVEKRLAAENEIESYYQAEAVKQAIEWYKELLETT